ncbi:site-specific DNA-methyltransferase [Diaphorobacter sp. MNS-0]|uniref:site-specific DNA-methyltransferase n=1 Tax=Diaphorobacter sp. MNS-0 TaxID=2866628 RepID=UPI001C72F11A|nr:site-specific DNA-methyltransferase [Diaphorobacter sp. MNS-0]QYY25556.1 site-specific DNA-methyltransferase [Diaphorobacter sp. MNS-0]
MTNEQQQLQTLLLNLLPADHTTVGNITLLEQFLAAAQAAGHQPLPTEADFKTAREALVAAGLAVKGKGRGGATARATGAQRPDFALDAPTAPAPAAADKQPKAPKAKPSLKQPDNGDTQVLAYRHPDRRKNNPEVGLVNAESDPEQPKTRWAYDPHLDPALQFDSARAQADALIADALASNDPAAMRHALQTLRRMGAPYLQWTGKAERTSFEVDTVSLHVHERIDAMSILSSVGKRQNASNSVAASAGGMGARGQKHPNFFQPGLFEAPFESVPLRAALDFYKHDRGWANRLVAGDSLLVMNSLLQKEGMAGQVQMIYIDPPYGIKYGSNFQPFVGKRDVKDRADADLTQEPEMIKAFRDTWELGIHSYLTYLRDRLLLARELLSDSGSVFVQISDENLHHVRELMDEVFGPENFLGQIIIQKTGGFTKKTLSLIEDYVVWYAKDKEAVKYRDLREFSPTPEPNDKYYRRLLLKNGDWRWFTSDESENPEKTLEIGRIFRHGPTNSDGPSSNPKPFNFQGLDYWCNPNRHWTVDPVTDLPRVARSGNIFQLGNDVAFKLFWDFNAAKPLGNVWLDTQSGGFNADKVYVVQTTTKVIERCMLMTTDPGDLVLDPTCGSGTTAYVAEKWGRRWITCDTSRVAITLAKQRLMTASFDYFALRYPHEGLRGGFIYKTVPHVTLKSIANNAEIDAIYERMHPAIASALEQLNALLKDAAQDFGIPWFTPTEGARKGQKLDFHAGDALLEWEVPFDLPKDWLPEHLRDWQELAQVGQERALTGVEQAFEAFHTARQKMQAEMDRSIAAHADSETLYDQPERDKGKLRVCGPFTVEAVPFPTVLSLDELPALAGQGLEADFADNSLARSGHTSRQHAWRDELLKTGIRGKGGQMLRFAELEVLPGTTSVHASGSLDTGERVVVSFGPEHGALEQRQVERALNEAGELFPRPKMIVFCAFAFDPEAAKDIDALKGITALKAQMNTDLLTEDLKKARSSNQSFWLMGQPDVLLTQLPDGLWQVEVNGFDYFDTAKGELVSGGKGKIAAWQLDTDYDGRSLFPHQVFFPMAGKDEGWMKLKKDIRAELDTELLQAFTGTVSLPFAAGDNRTVAVKIVDDRGIESLKVMRLDASATQA